MARFNVLLSENFNYDVESQLRFLANVSISAAKRLNNEFKKTIKDLKDTADYYPIFYKQYRKVVVANRYAVFYEIVDKNVYVEHSFDMRTGEYNDIVLDM